MNKLDELMMQKKAIEEQIRQLKNLSKVVGDVKLDVEHYPTDKPDRHYLALYYQVLDSRPRWRSIYSAEDRESVIAAIPAIINSLTKFYNEVKAEGTDENVK